MIQQTSLLAYLEVKPNLGQRQNDVLNAIMFLGKCTDQQIMKHLGWPINCITNRRGELLKKGLIKEAGLIKNEGNRLVTTWEVV